MCSHSLKHTYCLLRKKEPNGAAAENEKWKMAVRCLAWATRQETAGVTEDQGTVHTTLKTTSVLAHLPATTNPLHFLQSQWIMQPLKRLSLVYLTQSEGMAKMGCQMRKFTLQTNDQGLVYCEVVHSPTPWETTQESGKCIDSTASLLNSNPNSHTFFLFF